MRKFLAFLGLIAILVFSSIYGVNAVKENVKKDLAEPVELPSSPPPTRAPKNGSVHARDIKRSIFVPYWGLDELLDTKRYDEFLYFGITPGNNGIDRQEEGYEGLEKFIDFVPDDSGSQLVLRMLDSDVTFPILKDVGKQTKLIQDTINIARKYNFSGVVLDLEISAVPFDSLLKQVNTFTGIFYKEAKKSNLDFAIMFYGDTFHRIRPFDVKALSRNADEFYIMSYDFSKSRGNPGPNFPLQGKEVYGYDITEMTSDFLRFLPAEKTTVVFGLFGYDWEVDNEGVAIGQGKPLTYKQIEAQFLSECDYVNCSVRRKNDSRETEIKYKDEEGKDHIVWFEDKKSIEDKEDFFKKQGIGSFSLWAYSYF